MKPYIMFQHFTDIYGVNMKENFQNFSVHNGPKKSLPLAGEMVVRKTGEVLKKYIYKTNK